VAVLAPGAQYFVAPDHLGAPHQITDSGGNVVWLWDHDPFGNGTPTGTFGYNLRFPGQFYDQQTGLHYNYYRDYDPAKGRYLESDPIGLNGGINTYAYVGGNPVDYVDPDGRIILPIVTAALGAAGGAGGSVIGQLISNGGKVNCINWNNVLIATGVGAVAGALAPTYALTTFGAMVLGATANTLQYGITQYANADPISLQGAAWSAGTGALGGAWGGAFKPGLQGGLGNLEKSLRVNTPTNVDIPGSSSPCPCK
jgi:RHS repeat-associated protein